MAMVPTSERPAHLTDTGPPGAPCAATVPAPQSQLLVQHAQKCGESRTQSGLKGSRRWNGATTSRFQDSESSLGMWRRRWRPGSGHGGRRAVWTGVNTSVVAPNQQPQTLWWWVHCNAGDYGMLPRMTDIFSVSFAVTYIFYELFVHLEDKCCNYNSASKYLPTMSQMFAYLFLF